MADLIWVYGEVVDGRVTRATLEMLSRGAALGRAEAVLLGPGPLDFRFIINSVAGNFVANGANPDDLQPPAGPNFFATFDIGWDPVAKGGPGPLTGMRSCIRKMAWFRSVASMLSSIAPG